MNKLFLSAIALTAITSPVYAARPSVTNVHDFAQNISNKVIDAIKSSNNNIANKQRAFADIFKDYGDVTKIAKFVSGKAWRNADANIQNAYVQTYGNYMAFTYAARITGYNNQSVKIGRVVDLGDNGFIVHTAIDNHDGQKPIDVTWQLSINANNELKVTDLRIENISMALTQKAEFEAILMGNGYNLANLTQILNNRMK